MRLVKSGHPFSFLSVTLLLGFLLVTSAFGQPFTNTITLLENQKPGTAAWLLTNPAPLGGIEGYASLTSVNRGGQIKLFVNTTNSFYTLEVYRIGWYDGLGAREVLGPLSVPGYRQVIPRPDSATGLVECNWTNPCVLNVPATPGDPTDWASGAYLAKLTGGQDGYQSYIIFAVRDDQRASDLLVQFSYTTYEAYNEWGGTGLYLNATKVSFNRPYQSYKNVTSATHSFTYNPYWNGSGEFFSLETAAPGFECNLVRWLEREGYDVSYCTSVDTHANSNLLANHKAFISAGHDEYWSAEMRQNVQSARDNGINLAFLSSNVSYWQVRFEPGTFDGASNRTVVCYKSTNDPVYSTASNSLTTIQFRQAPVFNPESSLIGVQYGYNPIHLDMVVNDPTHWVFTNTGVTTGQRFAGLLGYEVDSTNETSPAGIQVACNSPFLRPGSYLPPPSYSQMTSYTAPSGATVFATGSMQWNWGLDDFNSPTLRPSFQSPVAQQVTRNILARMINQPAPSPTLFFRTDKNTKGTWKPAYGTDGYVLPGDSTNLPNYAVLDFGGVPVTNCLSAITDTNSLQISTGNGRNLANWSAPGSFVVDVNLTDSAPHQVALYFWDWNNAGRRELVELLDAQTTNLLDSRVLNNFTNGQWWVWQATGHVLIRVTTLSGPDCLLGAVMLGSGTQAASTGEDQTTSGNWPLYYGADGSYIAGAQPRPASYASITIRSNLPSYWSLDTADPRAPLNSFGGLRPFAAWNVTGDAINSVNITVNDNAWHQLAVYCVDQEMLGRTQLVSLVDPANNAVLDSRVMTNFGGGQYLSWNYRGNIQLRFQSLNQLSAVVSGIFLGTPNQPPSVAITAPTNSQSFSVPATINLAATASDTDGFVAQVGYYTNGNLLATVTNAPFVFVWTNAPPGQYLVTAIAVDDRAGTAVSAPVSISVNTPSGYHAPFVRITSPSSDSPTIASSNVFFAAIITSNSAAISNVQFILDGSPAGSLMSNAPFSQTISNLTLGRHTVGAVVVDALGIVTSSASRSFSVLPASNSMPSVTLIAPTDGTVLSAPASLRLTATATWSAPGPCRVDFYANGNLLGSDNSGSPFSLSWRNVASGTYVLTAVAVDSNGSSNVSATATITVGIPAVANFVGIDTSQQGDWPGVYGSSGYVVEGAGTNLPNYVSLAANSQFILWTNSTSQRRVLATGNSGTRVAAQLYSFTNLTLDLDLKDGIYHRVGLYYMDWLNQGITEYVDVLDSLSGQVLDHQLIGPFVNGTYEFWDVRGHVLFSLYTSNNLPAVVSGLFVDASPNLAPIFISNPQNGASFSSPASFTLQANILGNPNISEVDLYQNSTMISSSTNGPPYIFGLTNLPPGSNFFTVSAVTPFGSLTSQPISINVLPHQEIKITSLTFQPDGTLRLVLTGPDEDAIRIETTTDPTAGNPWIPVITNSPGQFIFNFPNDNSSPQRFYRAAIVTEDANSHGVARTR